MYNGQPRVSKKNTDKLNESINQDDMSISNEHTPSASTAAAAAAHNTAGPLFFSNIQN